MKFVLYLGSKSPSRQFLLKENLIPFTLIEQDADEHACDWSLPLEQVVLSISLHKMENLEMPHGKEGDVCFVLTADTLSQDIDGNIEGKPTDREDAARKIKKARSGSRLCSAFCLDKKRYSDGAWITIDRIHQASHAQYKFFVPDEWIERYLDNSIGLSCSNAIAIDQYGGQFLKEIQGSYTAVVGLSMFELREALEKLGFYSQ